MINIFESLIENGISHGNMILDNFYLKKDNLFLRNFKKVSFSNEKHYEKSIKKDIFYMTR